MARRATWAEPTMMGPQTLIDDESTPTEDSTPIEDRSAPTPRRRVLRIVLMTVGGLVVVLALLVTISVVGAARTPGNEGFNAKWADWVRDHGGASFITAVENWYYTREQPKAGGPPPSLPPVPNTVAAEPQTAASATTHLARPPDVAPVVDPAVAGEGHWQPTGPVVDGAPGMYIAEFRADDVYTSQLTSAVWIDPTRLAIQLHPGTREPGGQFPIPPVVTGDAAAKLAAAFNGGFRFKDAKGGFWLAGQEAVPLVDGAASIELSKGGAVRLGAWNRDLKLEPDAEGVLQNLTLLVDAGQVDPAVDHNDTRAWGNTLKGRIAVARSGIGITADGALLYVAGPALTAKTLAESLQRAGAVRAMTLDINPEWVTFNLYDHPDPADPTVARGTSLYATMQRSADRYLTEDSRDFFTVSTR